MKSLLAFTALVLVLAGPAASSTSTEPFSPACPRPTYSADGNFSPLFCKIANPAAMAFYGRLKPGLLRLGPNATPQQVYHAFATGPYVTPPEACAAWHLFSYRNGWRFGGAIPMPAKYSGLCSP